MSVEVEDQEKRRELRSYMVGFALAVGMTAVAFLVVAAGTAPRTAYVVIAITAVAQVFVHFRFFLHISWKSTRDDLQLILFTTLIILLMAGGTIWILENLHHRMT